MVATVVTPKRKPVPQSKRWHRRPLIQVSLPESQALRIRELAGQQKISQSAVVGTAVTEFLGVIGPGKRTPSPNVIQRSPRTTKTTAPRNAARRPKSKTTAPRNAAKRAKRH